MRVAVALVLGLLVVLGGLVAVLSAERTRLAGSNNVFDAAGVAPIAPDGEACAEQEAVPGDTAAVRVHAQPASPSGGALSLRLLEGGRVLARGSLDEGWAEGEIDIQVSPVVEATRSGITLCFRNEGSEDTTLWGAGATGPELVTIDGSPTDKRVRLSYVRPGRESGWEILGTVAHRMGIGRGEWLEGWAFFGWLAALAGVLAAVVATVLGWRRA